MAKARYKRILLKLSGESLKGNGHGVIDPSILSAIAQQTKQLVSYGVETGIVTGGGNFWRGCDAETMGMDRVTADHAGMLATIINALALQGVLEEQGIVARTLSALDVRTVAEPYIRRRAIRHLEKGRVIIMAGGTGNPYMTTDTAAALRAIEIGAEIILMAKHNVDGVYNDDPLRNPQAKKFDSLSYQKAMELHLKVMDMTAFSLCDEHNIPIVVFDIQSPESIKKIILGESVGTLISREG